MRPTYKKIFATLLAFFILSPGSAALPPAQQTSEETLWNSLSVAAQLDLNSSQTENLINRFLNLFPDHSKAVNAKYMLAETEFQKENYQKAAVRFETFLAAYPESDYSDSAAFRLGECYYNGGAFNSANEAWTRMVQRYRHSALMPNALEYLILIAIRNHEWGRADEMMMKLRTDYPNYAMLERLREWRGIILYNLGDYDASAKSLEGIEDGKGAYYRGLSLLNLTLFQEAVSALKFVSQDSKGPYAESASFLKAEAFFQKKNYNIAIKEFQGFNKRFPSSNLLPYSELRLAACSLLVQQPEEALAAVERVLKGNPPRDVKAYGLFIKASTYVDLNKYKEAIPIFEKLSKDASLPALAAASLVRKAWALRNLGQIGAFMDSLKQLEERYPESPQMSLAKYLEGATLFEMGRWEEAGSRLEYGIIRYPYNTVSEAGLALMAISYSKGKKYDQLVTAANSALKLFEGYFTPQTGHWRAQAYYFIGKAYYEMGRYLDALPLFEKITLNFSDHALAPRAQLYLSWCLVEAGKLDRAREKVSVLKDNPKIDKAIVINARFLYATTFFNGKQYDKALSRFAEFIKTYPNDPMAPHAQYLMGLAFHQKKVYGSAIDEWVKCINKYPDNPLAQDAYLHIGDLYFRGEKYEEAAKFFGEFRKRWPKSKYEQDATWLEMQCYFNGKIDEKAIVVYPLYIEKFQGADNLEDARRQLEIVYFRRGAHGDPVKLEDFLNRYPKSPYAPSARYKLGDMAMEQKLWVRAAQEMEQFLRDYPKDVMAMEAQYALGLAYENLEQKQKAIVQYKNILDQYPNKPGAVDASFRLGMLHFKSQNYTEASKAFEFASKQKLSDDLRANVAYNLALCYENLGNVDKAAVAYIQFAKITKKKDQANEALMTAGLLLKKAEKYKQAIPYFEELLKSSGEKELELQAVNFIAECQTLSGSPDQSIKTYEKLLTMEPVNSDARLAGLAQLAYLYEQKKMFPQAIRVYERIAVSGGKQEWVKAAKERVQALSRIQNKDL